MKNLNRAFTAFMSLSFATGPAFAEENAAFIQFIRPLGMGGAFTAVTDDHNSFFFNPAGMVQRTGGQFTLMEVAGSVNEDALELKDFVDDNKDDLTDFDTISDEKRLALLTKIQNDITQLESRVVVAADIASYVSGPTFLGMPLHVGFGGFAAADAKMRIGLSATQVPTVSYEINGDAILPLSLAKRWDAPWIPGRIALGATGKFLRRGQVKQENIDVTDIEDFEAPDPSNGTGLGADIGVLYQPTNRFNFGVMVRDVGGTKLEYDAVEAKNGFNAVQEHSSVIRSRTNFGIALVPASLFWLLPTSDRWTFSFDLRDVFQDDQHILFENGFKNVIGENFGTHAHLGAEFRYWFMRFRGGAYQGYPSFGLGLDLPILKLDYAYYSRELGPLSGDKQEKNHALSLALRFGAGSTESRERINKSKEMKKAKGDAVPEAAPASESGSASHSAPQPEADK